ncbi:hypothetical protein COO60DRAFT_1473856 [Scenedesmus sp. NREL 46B-D3]|nr:hypothetical protein COO60DRAFT_1473856 [Scenedesmus sp. NREL 46B-D3]
MHRHVLCLVMSGRGAAQLLTVDCCSMCKYVVWHCASKVALHAGSSCSRLVTPEHVAHIMLVFCNCAAAIVQTYPAGLSVCAARQTWGGQVVLCVAQGCGIHCTMHAPVPAALLVVFLVVSVIKSFSLTCCVLNQLCYALLSSARLALLGNEMTC